MSEIAAILAKTRILPIITVQDEARAAPLAAALLAGGITACEVTLRTPAALGVITAMRRAAPDLWVGAGTIRISADIDAALSAGAQFLVTPGTPHRLAEALKVCGAPVLPGAATASEVMTLADHGFGWVKFFPAMAAGGLEALKSFAGPLPDITFCPTGGIGRSAAPAFLSLDNVACVGGSWVTPQTLLDAGDFDAITALARAASST